MNFFEESPGACPPTCAGECEAWQFVKEQHHGFLHSASLCKSCAEVGNGPRWLLRLALLLCETHNLANINQTMFWLHTITSTLAEAGMADLTRMASGRSPKRPLCTTCLKWKYFSFSPQAFRAIHARSQCTCELHGVATWLQRLSGPAGSWAQAGTRRAGRPADAVPARQAWGHGLAASRAKWQHACFAQPH